MFASAKEYHQGNGDKMYRSAEVRSHETFTYGRFTTRMKGSAKKGTVASLFTYWTGPNWSSEGWNEIDVEIVPSVEESPMSTNLIWQNA